MRQSGASQYPGDTSGSPSLRGNESVRDHLRVLIYSHDTFGLGHFRRCLKIARQFASDRPNSSILILTGSPLVDRYPLPAGVDTVKLPAVVKVGRELYQSRSSRLPLADLLSVRAQIIRTTAEAFAPNIVLIDHAPLGLQGEARSMLELMSQQMSPPQIILGLRDVVDDPNQVIPLWQSKGIYEAIAQLYDRVLVYGTREIYDPTSAYSFPASLTKKTSFVGYVCDPQLEAAPNHCTPIHGADPIVVLTVGGGEDGQVIVDTFLSMIERAGTDIGYQTILLPGPLLNESDIAKLKLRAKGLPVRIEHFVSDISPLLRHAAVVVAMGGYNTVSEILSHARRAIIIPRETPRREQLIRALAFEERDIVRVLRMEDLNPDALGHLIQSELDAPNDSVTDARRRRLVSLNGAEQVVMQLAPLLNESKEVGTL